MYQPAQEKDWGSSKISHQTLYFYLAQLFAKFIFIMTKSLLALGIRKLQQAPCCYSYKKNNNIIDQVTVKVYSYPFKDHYIQPVSCTLISQASNASMTASFSNHTITEKITSIYLKHNCYEQICNSFQKCSKVLRSLLQFSQNRWSTTRLLLAYDRV